MRPSNLDFLYTRTGFFADPAYDPTTSDFTITLGNANGMIYQGTLLPGDIQKNGRTFKFKDPTANRGNGIRSGIKYFSMSQRPDGLWRFQLKAFANLATATDPTMTVHVTTGGNEYELTADWTQRGTGWTVELKRLP